MTPLRAGPDHEERRSPAVAREASGTSPVLPRVALTRRQRQVVAAYVTGLMRKEVAHQLGIARNTVDVHLTAIFERTGFSNRTQLMRWWLGLDADGCTAVVARCILPAGHDGEHQATFS